MDAGITSKNNERLRRAKRLQRKKYRDQLGMFLLEGVRIVGDALATSLVDELFFGPRLYDTPRGAEVVKRAQNQGIPALKCSDEVLAELTETVSSQGVVAVVRKPSWPLSCSGLMLVADGIQDPGNMGSLLRTVAGAGVRGLLVVQGSVDLYNPKVVRSSMGAVLHLPHWYLSRQDILQLVRENGSTLALADLLQAESMWDVRFPNDVALVVGNEAWGIHADFRKEAQLRVEIPLTGAVESLNASVAAGILLYEILRQRRSIRNSQE